MLYTPKLKIWHINNQTAWLVEETIHAFVVYSRVMGVRGELRAQRKHKSFPRGKHWVYIHNSWSTRLQSLEVIFKNRAGVLYRNLKHEAIAECFRSEKAPIESFLNVLWNSPLNTLIREKVWKFMFSMPKELTSLNWKSHVSLSHIKTRHAYDFLLYFSPEFLINFINVYKHLASQFEILFLL